MNVSLMSIHNMFSWREMINTYLSIERKVEKSIVISGAVMNTLDS